MAQLIRRWGERMGYAKDQIDKNVMKVIRKMAAVEREEISLISENKKNTISPQQEFADQLSALFERGNDLIIELFKTDFAFTVLGCNPFESEEAHADNLQMLGEHLLGIYGLDRMLAEMDHEEPEEDVFYAGTYLVHRAAIYVANEEGYLDYLANDGDEIEIKWDEPHKKSRKSSKIVRLFDDNIN